MWDGGRNVAHVFCFLAADANVPRQHSQVLTLALAFHPSTDARDVLQAPQPGHPPRRAQPRLYGGSAWRATKRRPHGRPRRPACGGRRACGTAAGRCSLRRTSSGAARWRGACRRVPTGCPCGTAGACHGRPAAGHAPGGRRPSAAAAIRRPSGCWRAAAGLCCAATDAAALRPQRRGHRCAAASVGWVELRLPWPVSSLVPAVCASRACPASLRPVPNADPAVLADCAVQARTLCGSMSACCSRRAAALLAHPPLPTVPSR